jgi:hypothetical protein
MNGFLLVDSHEGKHRQEINTKSQIHHQPAERSRPRQASCVIVSSSGRCIPRLVAMRKRTDGSQHVSIICKIDVLSLRNGIVQKQTDAEVCT